MVTVVSMAAKFYCLNGGLLGGNVARVGRLRKIAYM